MRNWNRDRYVPASLKKVFAAIDNGQFGDRGELQSVIDTLRNNNDFYLVCADFEEYCRANLEVFFDFFIIKKG